MTSTENSKTTWVVTCEHGGNKVPVSYRHVFATRDAERWLSSHRGYDPGALDAASAFAKHLSFDLISSETTRLLVDLNRSVGNEALFSKFSHGLSETDRQAILDTFYHPYRSAVRDRITQSLCRSSRVCQLSIHTFTPRFRGVWRAFDVGLLFDPASPLESSICRCWHDRLTTEYPKLRVRMNEPYAGTDDGLTSELRQGLNRSTYAGIEVEINNRFTRRSRAAQSQIVDALLTTLPTG